MIKRYGFVGWEAFDEKDNGLYVLYTDHLAVVAEKNREIERLSDLLWGARCVFCGEVIGKEKKNQDIADEVLRQHIKSCPKHPLTIARARIKELEHNLEVNGIDFSRAAESKTERHLGKKGRGNGGKNPERHPGCRSEGTRYAG